MTQTNDPDQFTNVLQKFVNRSAYTPGQLAALSQMPKTTLVNWLNGRVQRPRAYRGIVAVAVALRLTYPEANQLLAAAQHPTISQLRMLTTDETVLEMLAFWETPLPAAPAHHAPFQAISLPAIFVGRTEEQAALKAALLAEEQTAVTYLYGMAGVGKTSLAAQAAYQLRHHFADGVLWARLDSSDAMSILATFAAAYQQDVTAYHDIASRSRLVRNVLMAKQVLIVLDNAETSAQIEPLLPPTGRCAVLITTRRQDLAILAGAKRIEIRPFAPQSAASLTLFKKFLGDALIQTEAHTLSQIASALGHLPLALVIAASRLAYEPGWQVPQFAARVQSVQQRLGTLQFETQNVSKLFQLSYDLLDEQAQQLLAAVGHLGRQPFSVQAAGAVAGISDAAAADGLRRLHSLSLVQSEKNGRFHFHPLLHDFAQSLPPPPQVAARLIRYWQAFTAEHVYDHERIADEMGHIEAAWRKSVELKKKEPLHQMLANLMPFLTVRGAYLQAKQMLAQARAVLTEADAVEALIWIQLWEGQIERHRHALDQAERKLQAGLMQARGNAGLTARFLIELGIIANCRDRLDQGKAYLLEALPLARDEEVGESLLNLLEEMGIIAVFEGEMAAAESYYQEGLALAIEQGDQSQEVIFLKSIGALRHLSNKPKAAHTLFVKGYALAQEIGFRRGAMMLENNLAVVAYDEGEQNRAQTHLHLARQAAEQLNDDQALRLITHNLACLKRGSTQQLSAANPSDRLKLFI